MDSNCQSKAFKLIASPIPLSSIFSSVILSESNLAMFEYR